MADGANVSKANVYAVLGTPDGASIAKANVYAVLSTEERVAVAKALAYAVIAEGAPAGGEVEQPRMVVCT